MIGANSAGLMTTIRLERTNMLIIEARESLFASSCKEILPDNIIVRMTKDAATSDTSTFASPHQLRQSVIHLNESFNHLLDTIVRQPNAKFGRIICLNRPDLTSTSTLAANLRAWTHWLEPGGRIVVQTFDKDPGAIEGWWERERRYREAVERTPFNFEQINGVEREADFLTGVVELRVHLLAIKRTAQMIRSVDSERADIMESSAKKLRRRLARLGAHQQPAALNMLLKRSEARDGGIFVTLRLG